MELNKRMKNILTAVVHRFITTAEPVSSAVIAQKYGVRLSKATLSRRAKALNLQFRPGRKPILPAEKGGHQVPTWSKEE